MEANELFTICTQLAQSQPSIGGLRRMHQLLVLCCGSVRGMAFGNLFAQIDWLCKQRAMPLGDTIAVQTARLHSNGTQVPSRQEWLYDLRGVALFVSAVMQASIPDALLRLLPPTNRLREQRPVVNRRYLRCVVESVETATFWANSDDGPVCVDYQEHAYLQKILRPGMQLNLLDAVQTGTAADAVTTIKPTIIIIEPDFLIDISALASCFSSYGHHPLLYTLNRLKSRPNTQAVLLGNFAGTALDALVHNPQATTADVLRRSFHEQALRFCACDDFVAAKFKMQAEEQMRNLRQATAQLGSGSGADGPLFLLEPSFVCERLGLQGRVDLMTADMHLLVEQKSGKNQKIERNSSDRHGRQLESHYVQLLLYYGVLRYNFQKTDRQVDMRLLYSRYAPDRGLLSVNYYRTLFREALKLRNQIVATELLVARDGFGRLLPLLSVDVVYKGVAADGHFHRYIASELSALSAQLSALSPLERAYYTTMLTFVYREQAVQKIGSPQSSLHHSGGCTADLWQMPLSEKLATGNIYAGLHIVAQQKSSAEGGFDIVTLSQPHAAAPSSPPQQGTAATSQPASSVWQPSNFRPGDMVYLYQYDDIPDVRRSILYKGTLRHVGDGLLTVALSNGQQNARLFAADSHATWAVEHGGSDVGTNSAIRGLQQFIGCDERRRQLLLGQRPPEADTSLRLSRSYNAAYDDIVLRQRQARDYFLLQGPPGTGKTSMALRFMVLEELAAAPRVGVAACSVLLTAYTNRAVDEICAMLDAAAVPYLRIGSDTIADEDTMDGLLRRIASTPVVAATTSMLQAHPYILQVKTFSLCIVDEASQILEPSIIGLLSSNSIGRFVLVGDHKQLPAVVQQDEAYSLVDSPLLHAIGITDCRQSLFERLLHWEQHEQRTRFTGVLNRQGRMHPEVAAFPATHFYQREQLGVVPLKHQQEAALPYRPSSPDALDRLLCAHRMLFLPVVPTALPDNEQCNEAEAAVVASIARRIAGYYGERFDPATTLGIIVPYRSQIAAIRQAIELQCGGDALSAPLSQLSIDTVERYQGSQRDVIVYSTTVSRRYQLDFLSQSMVVEDGQPIDRKLNVALTRARLQTIVVGNPAVLRHNALYRQITAIGCDNEYFLKNNDFFNNELSTNYT